VVAVLVREENIASIFFERFAGGRQGARRSFFAENPASTSTRAPSVTSKDRVARAAAAGEC